MLPAPSSPCMFDTRHISLNPWLICVSVALSGSSPSCGCSWCPFVGQVAYRGSWALRLESGRGCKALLPQSFSRAYCLTFYSIGYCDGTRSLVMVFEQKIWFCDRNSALIALAWGRPTLQKYMKKYGSTGFGYKTLTEMYSEYIQKSADAERLFAENERLNKTVDQEGKHQLKSISGVGKFYESYQFCWLNFWKHICILYSV